MNYQEALNYIHTNFWQGSKPGLERTYALLEKMGNPQNKLKFIHVAGTNGKGSFCAMLSSILRKANLKVGTFTSPYIVRFNERMKVNGKDISDKTLAQLTTWIQPLADSLEEKPTEFELITALAMEYFHREKCDIVVLECGMGGRLDSTNTISSSVLSVITGISLDHTAFLGNSIREIAFEKAGIIKRGCPVLYCGECGEAENVIQQIAKEKNAPFFTVNREDLIIHKTDLNGTIFSANGFKELTLALLGSYQPKNAQNVLKAIEQMTLQGYQIPEKAIREGLKEVKWPARFEVVSKSPILICDGGHNPEGVESAVESVKMYFGKEKIILITGVMADKDYNYMASKMAEVTQNAICIQPSNPRALEAKVLAEVFQKLNVDAKAAASPKEALLFAFDLAKKEKLSILCLGSLYMYGEIISAL